MAQMAHHGSESTTGYRVEVPRACDAVGAALRDAFERDYYLPDDMAALLYRIDSSERRTSH